MASNKFIRVDKRLVTSPILTANEKLIVLTLISESVISYKQLSRQTGLSVSTVQRAIRSLEEKGIVSHEVQYSDEDGNGANIYSVVNNPDVWACQTLDELQAVINEMK